MVTDVGPKWHGLADSPAVNGNHKADQWHTLVATS
jgi:hypothetical protein